MSLQIASPFQQFFDRDGSPLDNGFIYVGTVNLNPETNPLTIYYDDALTIPAAQPLRTSNGYIVRNGSPARLYTSQEDFSLTVRDKSNVLVFTVADATSLSNLQTQLASSSGSSLVGYNQGGTGAVTRTVQARLRDYVSVKDFGAVGNGVTDDTTAIQLAATHISTTGGTLFFPAGDYVISTRIDFTGNNVNCVLDQDAGIVYNTPDYVAFKFTGTNSSVVGGLGRGFIGPAAWDGANTPPTYGVIWFTGDGSYAKTRLFNVRKMGIWFKDVVDGTAEGCIIEGNYPSASWTGTEVGHVGVGFDTDVANAGNFKVLGCTIKSCVQGAFPANYGTGGVTQGFVATGNIFEGCWNHGIYSNFTNGAVITGNNFNRCQIPVVVSGDANTVTGNTMYTAVNTTGDERDVVGISVRDGSRNIVTGNTIKGVIAGGPTGVIVVQDVSGLSELNDNIISNNTIEITAGSGAAIRVQGTTNGVNRNIIEGNNITCPGFGAARGAIELIAPSSTVNAGNKIVNNVVSLTALSEFVFATYQTASEVRGNTFELLWNAGSATTVNAVWWGQGVQCNTQDNTLLCRTGYGANITFRGFRESLASSDNFITNIINAVGGSATYAFALTVAASGLTINQLGTGAPTTQAKIGSIWRRSDGGAGTTFYVKESGTDATGWVGK
jgi:hypothetical protein